MAQEHWWELVPRINLEFEFVSSNDSIGRADYREVHAAMLTVLLSCTPATGTFIRKVKYDLGVLWLCWRWSCQREQETAILNDSCVWQARVSDDLNYYIEGLWFIHHMLIQCKVAALQSIESHYAALCVKCMT